MGPATFTEVALTAQSAACVVGLPCNVNAFLRAQKLEETDFVVVDDAQDSSTAAFGGFFPLEGHGAFSALAYRVSLASDTLTLAPTHFVDKFKSVYASLAFKFPSPVAFNCVSLIQSHDQIFLDVLLQSGILATLVLDLESFTQNCSLHKSNVYQWCRYSMPSALSQRTPLFMKPLDPLHTLVSLADGGVLMLSRTTPFDPFSDKLFTSTSYLDSWNFFKGSRWSRRSAIPDAAEFDGNTVNTKALIDVLPFSDDIFITLSVDKLLTFWSKTKQSIIKKYDMNEFLPENLHSAILSPYLPRSSLKFIDNILSVFVPIDKTFVYLLDLDSSLNISLMKTLRPPVPNDSWLPLDYVVTSSVPGTLEYWFTWYFGQSTMYHQCVIDQDFGVEWYTTTNKSDVEDLDIERFILSVKGGNEGLTESAMRFIKTKYPQTVLSISAGLFSEHYSYNFETMSIDEQLDVILSQGDADLPTFQKQIIRFASVCQDIFIKSCDNVLSMYVSKNRRNQFVYILKSNGYSVVRKSTPMELLLFNRTSEQIIQIADEDVDITELVKLVDLVLDFASKFPSDVQSRIHKLLVVAHNANEATMNEIFQNEIVNVVTNDVVTQLLDSLSQIKDASHMFEYLAKLYTSDPTDYIPVKGAHYSKLGEQLLKESIYYNNTAARKVLFGFQLILLTLDISEPIVDLFCQVNRHLINIELYYNVHQITSHDFVSDFIKHQFNGGMYFEASNIDVVISKLVQSLSSDNFKYFVVSNLLALDSEKSALLAMEFWKYLPDNGIGKVLRGLMLLQAKEPEAAKDLFLESMDQITSGAKSVTKTEKEVLAPVWDMISILFVPSPTDYYYNSSLVFEKMKFDQTALFFSMKALDNSTMAGHTVLINDILLNVFTISLRLHEYDKVFDAITQMDSADQSGPLRMFVYNLFQEGHLKRLLDFDFGENFLVVDDLIWDMGEEAIGVVPMMDQDISLAQNSSGIIDCKLALKYYRICYALRLKRGDIRGGAEALDRFNSIMVSRLPLVNSETKLSRSSEVEMVLDNFLMISNLLQTLESDDDRWILRKPVGNAPRNTLMSFDDLQRQWKSLEASFL